MTEHRKPAPDQARIAKFAKVELQRLVDTLYSDRKFETSAPTVLGALVLAARALPLEIVIALVPAYIEREQAELAREDAAKGDS